MAMEICVLGSGSSGNSTLLRLGGWAMLIDGGFGPRATAKRLAGTGVALRDIRAIVLTHLDSDHFSPTWGATLAKLGLAVYCHERHVGALYAALGDGPCNGRVLHRMGLIRPFTDQPFTPTEAGGSRFRPMALKHDRDGTCGFVVEHGDRRLAYATDLGSVPRGLIEAFTDVDVLAIESNYDERMQRTSNRPAMLIRRIMGGRGHLSNDQSFEAVRAIVSRSSRAPRHIVLLHLSRQCNSPAIVKRVFGADEAVSRRLCITSQAERTGWLRVGAGAEPIAGEQLSMFTA